MTAFVHLVIGCENLRTEPRMGGGFTILVGEPGSSQRISFKSVEAAEAFGKLCALAAITHGRLGDALAKTEGDNVVRLPVSRPDHQPEPPRAA